MGVECGNRKCRVNAPAPKYPWFRLIRVRIKRDPPVVCDYILPETEMQCEFASGMTTAFQRPTRQRDAKKEDSNAFGVADDLLDSWRGHSVTDPFSGNSLVLVWTSSLSGLLKNDSFGGENSSSTTGQRREWKSWSCLTLLLKSRKSVVIFVVALCVPSIYLLKVMNASLFCILHQQIAHVQTIQFFVHFYNLPKLKISAIFN